MRKVTSFTVIGLLLLAWFGTNVLTMAYGQELNKERKGPQDKTWRLEQRETNTIDLTRNTVFLSEDFSGNELPAGWTTEELGDPGYGWEFDFELAFIDSDAAMSGNNVAGSLTTPALDLTAASNVFLDLNHYYLHLSSIAQIKISTDGINWDVAYEFTTTVGNTAYPLFEYDLTFWAAGESEVYIQFFYDDLNAWAWYWDIDNVVVYEFIPPDCPEPTALAATNITATSADLGWTPGGDEELWNIEWGPEGFELGTVTGTLIEGVTDIPYTLDGLEANTSYDFYVQADCGSGAKEVSEWAGPFTFTTACEAFVLPFFEGFDAASVDCWDFESNWNIGTLYAPPSSTSGTPHAYFSWSPSQTNYSFTLTSPVFDASDVTNDVFFDYLLYMNNYSTNTVESMAVEYKTTASADWTELEVFTNQAGTAEYVRVGQLLPGMAGNIFQVRFRAFGENSFNINGWGLDDVAIYAPTLGALAGIVTEGTRSPIVGARVFSGAYEAFTDETGFYEIEGIIPGTYDFTAEAEGYIAQVAEDIEILAGETTELDFQLGYATIAVDPESLEETLEPDDMSTQILTISNPTGIEPLEWSASIQILGETRQNVSIPPAKNQPQINEDELSILKAPFVNYSDAKGTFNLMRGTSAFGFEMFPGSSFIGFDTDDPTAYTFNIPTTFTVFAADFDQNEVFYAIDNATATLHTVDLLTGDFTLVGATIAATDLAFDYTSNTMYAAFYNGASSDLYTIDLTTGAATMVGNIGTGIIISMACDGDGQLYGFKINDNNFYSIDKNSGSETLIGPVGFNGNFAQSMAWDAESDIIYMAAYEGTLNQGQLRVVDKVTGATELIGVFPGGAEICGLGFKEAPVSWLSIEPKSGTVAPGESFDVEVTFDATDLVDTTYYANININHNGQLAGRGTVTVPVELTVASLTPPAAATLLTPENNTTFVPLQPEFTWINGPRTAQTRLVITQGVPPFGQTIFTSPWLLEGESLSLSDYGVELNPKQNYNWRVLSRNAAGTVPSDQFTFQSIGAGTIAGTVNNAFSGEPMEGVTITAEELRYSAVTGPDGSYFIENVVEGDYTLTASKDGFTPETQVVEVVHGANVIANFELNIILDPPLSFQATIQDVFDVKLTWNAPMIFTDRATPTYEPIPATWPTPLVVQAPADEAEAGSSRATHDHKVVTMPLTDSRSVLYDNGPLVTGECATTLDPESMIQPPSTLFGSNFNNVAGFSVADDFTVPEGQSWVIENVELFGYQTGSTTTSSFTGAFVRIWDGDPTMGGEVIWGDLTTNLMSSTEFTGVYRVSQTASCNTQRPIMKIVAATAGLELLAGTYWIEYTTEGSIASGPWVPPVSYVGMTYEGNNGLQNVADGTWQPAESGGVIMEWPFILNGSVLGGMIPDNLLGFNLYRDDVLLDYVPLDRSYEYMDENLDPGTYSYTATAVYIEGESPAAGPRVVSILAPPTLLVAEQVGPEVYLEWESNFVGKGDNIIEGEFHSTSAGRDRHAVTSKEEKLHGPTVRVPQSTGSRAIGDDCLDPIIVGALPYTDVNTTCGRGNTYSETCLGNYDGGEDIVYQLVLTESKVLEISMTTTATWTGMLITDECPIGMNCIDFTTSSSGNKSLTVDLAAGTYYIMLDTWPTPDCISEFTLTIEEFIPGPGDVCATAVTAVEGLNTAPSAPFWYEFTPATDGQLTISSCLDGQLIDTDLIVYDACGGDIVAANDDLGAACGFYQYASAVSFPAEAGVSYKIQWLDTWTTDGFDFLLELGDLCVVDCPPEGIVEGELCGEDLNGGCNADVPVFESIAIGDVICGTAWADDGSRDTDWFELVIDSPKEVTFSVTAEFPLLIGLIQQVEPGVPGCDNITGFLSPSVTADPCEEASVTIQLIPGTHYFFVAPSLFDGYPCGTANNYVAELTAEDAFLPFFTVYRDGDAIADVFGTTYFDTDVVSGEDYCYTVTESPQFELETGFSNELCVNIPLYGELAVNPTSLFEVHDPSPDVTTQTIILTNDGDGVMDFGIGVQLLDDGAETSGLCVDPITFTTGCSLGDGITSWSLANVNIPDIPCTGTPAWYQDYTDMVHELVAGETYELITTTGFSNNYITVWIDFSNDLDLTADEIVHQGVMPTANVPTVFAFTVPEDAPGGTFVMRAITNWNSQPLLPCGTYTWGNVQDFTANISADKWVMVEPEMGTLNPGESIPVTVTFNSEDLDFGSYFANLNIVTNNPFISQPEVVVPVTLEVAPPLFGELFVDPTSLSETHAPGPQLTTQTIIATNDGEGLLYFDLDIDYGDDAFRSNEWTVNVFDTGWGDEVTWELKDNTGTVILSGGLYGSGYDDTQTVLTANEPLTFYIEAIGAFNDNTPNYVVSCSGEVIVEGQLLGGDEATYTDLTCGGELCEVIFTSGCQFGDGLTSWSFANVVIPDIPCTGDPAWYKDFTDQVHELEAGETYDLTVTAGFDDQWFTIWVDLNNDYVLTPDEIFFSGTVATSNTPTVFPITVPADAPLGTFAVRVITKWQSPAPVDPCGTYSFGNVFDFTATISGETPPPPPSWLSVSPESGMLNPGESMPIVVTFNSEGLDEGAYYAALNFFTNNPFIGQPEVSVPVELIVGGQTQDVLLAEGWSGWSSYIDPMMDAMFADVVAPVVDDMIITQYFTDVFYPAYGINTMGAFSNAHGYVTKMDAEAVLTLQGMMVDPTVDFVTGWNLMPLLVDCNLAAADVFGGITGFIIAYEVAGSGIYWPGEVTTLTELVPGKAYWVKVNAPSAYTFPECLPEAKASYIAPLRHANTTGWNDVSYTGLSHIVVFDDNASVQFAHGDVIGAFTADGTIAGLTVYNGTTASLVAFGEDITTAANDGFAEGEQLSFKLYRHANQTEYILDVTYSAKAPNYDGQFANHGLSIINDMSMTATGISTQELSGLTIYPNPSDGLFNVAIDNLDREINYVIMDAIGQTITRGKLMDAQVIDLSDQPRGVYFIKFVGNDILRIEKLVLR